MNKQEAKHAAKFTRDMLDLMNGNNGEHWAKRSFASLWNWKQKEPSDKGMCYCVLGSGRRLVEMGRSYRIYWLVTDEIEDEIGKNIPIWNDSPKTTWKDVKRVLTKVAKKFDKMAVA